MGSLYSPEIIDNKYELIDISYKNYDDSRRQFLDKSIKKETFIQGYVVKDKNSGLYLGVRLLNDNSGKIIPAKVPSNINAEYPVNIMIKNHSASIISNVYPDTTSSKNSNIINNTAYYNTITKEEIDDLWKGK